MGTTNTLDLNNRISALEKGGSGGTPDGASRADIATEFDATKNYTAGCFVYYVGKLYQFNTDHAAGAWDSTDVVEANVTDQIVSNKAAIDGLTASDVAYDNTDSGLTATDVQEAVDEVVDEIVSNKIIYIKKPLTDFVVATAWGAGLYMAADTVDISSLGLQNIPDVVCTEFQSSSGTLAMPMLGVVSASQISVSLVRGSNGTVSGTIILGLKSNG